MKRTDLSPDSQKPQGFIKHGFAASVILALTMLVAVAAIPSGIQAESLNSDSFIIQFGNFNITAGEKDSANYHLTDTVGQTAAGPFGQYGSSSYFVGSGFQYIYQIDRFSFTISDLDINLGTLFHGTHNTGTNDLTITTGGAGGYKVYAYELHPLRHTSSLVDIPNTTCDLNNCDETFAEEWSNQNIPGFGYNSSGPFAPGDFLTSTYFRSFADASNNEEMQVVMSSNNVANKDTTTITYKAGVAGALAAGTYSTGIVYVAVPGF